MTVETKLKSVTIFPDRALVTAAVELKISPGMSDVRIDGLPLLTQKDSVRDKCFAEQVIKDRWR